MEMFNIWDFLGGLGVGIGIYFILCFIFEKKG